VFVLGLLGKGGVGSVYRARDAHGREVALKIVPRKNTRLEREAEATAALRHANVLAVHASGVEGERGFIVYELVEHARSLTEAFAGLTWRERVELLAQVVQGVAHAHSKGICHRDLKPENVLVDREGRVRVADFGLALVEGQERLTKTGVMLGTPAWMSPEQVGGKKLQQGPATDVWALGAMLYLAMTGEEPFVGSSLLEFAAAIMQASPTPPRELESSLPRALEEVCLRALRKDPAERYPDAQALGVALREARAEAPSLRRWKRALGALVGFALLVASGVALGLALRQPRGEAAPPSEVSRVDSTSLAAQRLQRRVDHLSESGQLALGLAEVEVLLEEAPESARAWDSKGVLLMKAARFREAKPCFARALRLDPKHPHARSNFGFLRHREGDAGGMKDMDAAVKLAPDSPRVHSKRALARYEREDWAGALKDANRALDLDPRHIEAWNTRGLAHTQFELYEPALRDFEALLRLEKTALGHCNRASVLIRLGHFSRAERDLKAARRLAPREPQVWVVGGVLAYRTGDYVLAEARFTRLLRLAPKERARWLFQRASVRQRGGRLALARADAERILREFPKSVQAEAARGLLRQLPPPGG